MASGYVTVPQHMADEVVKEMDETDAADAVALRIYEVGYHITHEALIPHFSARRRKERRIRPRILRMDKIRGPYRGSAGNRGVSQAQQEFLPLHRVPDGARGYARKDESSAAPRGQTYRCHQASTEAH